jgi:hypothetical protein
MEQFANKGEKIGSSMKSMRNEVEEMYAKGNYLDIYQN